MPQSTIFKLAAVAVAAMTVTACGQGASVGVEANKSEETSSRSDNAETQTLSNSKSAKVGQTTPPNILVAQAAQAIVDAEDLDLEGYVLATKFKGGALLPVDAKLKEQGFNSPKDKASFIKSLQEHQSSIAARSSSKVHELVQSKFAACVNEATSGDPAVATQCLSDYYTHVYTAAAVLATVWPQKGSGLRKERNISHDKQRIFPEESLNQFVTGAVSLNNFVTSPVVLPAWVDVIKKNSYRTIDMAGLPIATKLFATPTEVLKAASERVHGQVEVHVSPGEPGSSLEVHVPQYRLVIVQNEKGLVVTRNGSPWLGDGYIAGLKTDVTQETSLTASQEARETQSEENSVRTGKTFKAGVSLPQ